jgi:hypothetical protein
MSKNYFQINMNFTQKILLFVIVFSLFFMAVHVSGFYDARALMNDLGGLPWLYSSLVALFSILVGFVVQKQWENWNNLVDSVKSEVDSLRELFLWSRYLPQEYKDRFSKGIKFYLKEMSASGLQKSERGEKSEKIEKAFSGLQEVMFELSEKDPARMTTTFSFFSKILEARSNRLRYGSHHVPQSLKSTLKFCTFLVIILSLFIGIRDVWLDYTFTVSLSLVAFIIYIVIDDLDNPLTPGNWHLTKKNTIFLQNRFPL